MGQLINQLYIISIIYIADIVYFVIGYSIFIVRGDLPECEADQILRFAPAVQPIKPRLINESQSVKKSEGSRDDQLQQALAESRQLDDNEDKMLQKALQMSMEGRLYDVHTIHACILAKISTVYKDHLSIRTRSL